MPYFRRNPYARRYRPRRNFRRKPRRFRRKRFARNTTIIRAPSAYPDRLYVKLKYSDHANLVSSTSAAYHVFRGNGIFDPDFTGTGHQPYGRDQWMAMYTQNCVLASKIQVRAMPYSNQSVVALRPSVTTTAPSDINEILERPRCQYKMLNAAGGDYFPFKSFMKTKTILGPAKPLQDDEFWSTSSNPTKQWYWIIGAQHPDLTTGVTTQVYVMITYYVCFFSRTQVSAS